MVFRVSVWGLEFRVWGVQAQKSGVQGKAPSNTEHEHYRGLISF